MAKNITFQSNNNESFIRPEPKYKVGQLIKYSNFVNGRIEENPIWNNIYSEWSYGVSYGLGLTSDANKLESQIVLLKY